MVKNMKIKKSLAACIISTVLFSSSAISGGIPVFDGVANVTDINQWIEKVAQWEKTVVHYKDQMSAYKEQLATATGIRDVQAFMNQAKNLTNDIKNLQQRGISLNDLLTNPGGAFTSELNGLYDKYKVFDSCNASASGTYLNSCKQMVLNQAVAVEETSDVQNKIADVLSDISQLSGRVEQSKDAKESQDLANVVAAKSVQLNALTSQWEMSVKQAELRANMLATQRQKAFAEQQLNAPVADLNNL
ncbi:P-type DNA transfer protein VirB5 [Hafnia alvei]|nr:P-type DNA transfer protein VirB5 [Hafnia alvei]